jgi:3-methyladenine DNA glycosylase AlkD
MLYALWHTMYVYSYMAGNFNYLSIQHFKTKVSNLNKTSTQVRQILNPVKKSSPFFRWHFTAGKVANRMLYSFFRMIPRRTKFMCRRFGTLCSISTRGVDKKNNWDEIDGMCTQVKFWLKTYCSCPQDLRKWNSVPKRRHIKFRRRGITHKKTYIIQCLI